MQRYRALVVGGYGFFGSRLVRRLARQPNLEIIVAGRNIAAADALVSALRPIAAAHLRTAAFDAMTSDLAAALAELKPHVVVHTSGPFKAKITGWRKLAFLLTLTTSTWLTATPLSPASAP